MLRIGLNHFLDLPFTDILVLTQTKLEDLFFFPENYMQILLFYELMSDVVIPEY